MWNWIADQIEKDKEKKNVCELKYEYLTHKTADYNILNDCFLCEYTVQLNVCADTFLKHEFPNCIKCPLQWPSSVKEFMCEYDKVYRNKIIKNGLWRKCCNMFKKSLFCSWKRQANLAREIANLPEREFV